MLRLFTKKRAAALIVVGSLVVAGGAYAYFTSTGSGSGSGTVGKSTGFTVTDTSVPVTLYPGTGSFSVAGTVLNGGSANQGLATLTTTINAPTVASGAPVVTGHACGAGDFALSAANNSGWVISNNGGTATYTYSANNELAAGASVSYPGGLSIAMVDQQYDQDNCQGATANWTTVASS